MTKYKASTRVICDIVAAERAKVGASLDPLIIAQSAKMKQPWAGWKLSRQSYLTKNMAVKFSISRAELHLEVAQRQGWQNRPDRHQAIA